MLLSRIHISTITTPCAVDFKKMAEEQQKDFQLQNILAGSCSTFLVLQLIPMGQPSVTLYYDVSKDRICPFVPKFFRREIFNNLHTLSHPEIRVSQKLLAERYVWPSMRQDVIYGLLHAYSANWQKYLGIQEAILKNSSHQALDSSTYTSILWDPYLHQRIFVTASLVWTVSPNGQKHFHWHREAADNSISSFSQRPSQEVSSAIESGYDGVCQGSADTELPTIFLGSYLLLYLLRATWKEDLQVTTTEIIYGAPIRLPGQFLWQSKQNEAPVTFVGRLKKSMQRLSPPTTRHQGQNTIFVSKDLIICCHIFLWTPGKKACNHHTRVSIKLSAAPKRCSAS
ncbi:integrase catalytic domain-containing protein [Nephila pilipes]|uniref:Integrase catalytic domain-containing protein n=1 Tax=Nephila pilipes TaxID=299642 RepID=A0A8X6MDJ0_NEPPI|nr:integrase catalytic domain-containing protein [Nephila pilipes]